MSGYPTPKVHRRGRRALGKGQSVSFQGLSAVVTASASTATITFSGPAVVRGIVPLTVDGGPTFVSQTIVSPTVVTQLFSAALAGKDWELAGDSPNVSSFQGGGLAGASGTF